MDNEIKKIRIGNDIGIEWVITRDGRPENFDGKNIEVKLLSYDGNEHNITYTLKENILYIDFLGKDQNKLGTYELLLIENNDEVGMSTLDQVEVFRLVAHTYQEGGQTACTKLKVESVELASNFSVKHIINVVDNLNSTSTKDTLSANQGRVLKERITQVEKKIPFRTSDLANDENFIDKGYVDQINRIQNEKILKNTQENEKQSSDIQLIFQELDNKVQKQDGYGLSQNNFTDANKQKLESIKEYDDSTVNARIDSLKNALDTLMGISQSPEIDTFEEVKRFLNGFGEGKSLFDIISRILQRLDKLEGK